MIDTRWNFTRLLGFAAVLLFASAVQGRAMNKADIKLNPNPRMRYEITATVEGAPGGFDSVNGHADYKVINEDCVPATPITGATIPPEKRLPLKFVRVSENQFKTVVFVDQVEDEDYFGRGVCHWSIVAAGAELHYGPVNFSPGIYHDDLLAQRAVVKYFSLKSYNKDHSEQIDIGADDPSAYTNPASTFRITLKAAERTQ